MSDDVRLKVAVDAALLDSQNLVILALKRIADTQDRILQQAADIFDYFPEKKLGAWLVISEDGLGAPIVLDPHKSDSSSDLSDGWEAV